MSEVRNEKSILTNLSTVIKLTAIGIEKAETHTSASEGLSRRFNWV